MKVTVECYDRIAFEGALNIIEVTIESSGCEEFNDVRERKAILLAKRLIDRQNYRVKAITVKGDL